MNILRLISLLRYNLRLLPGSLWLLVAIISLMTALGTEPPDDWRINDAWTVREGITTELSNGWFLFCALIGACFFGIRSRYEGGQILDGEFLLSRPVLRRTAYFSRVVFLFVLMLAPPLSVIYAERANPDLRVDFFHWTEPNTNTIVGLIQFYQKQFPDSSVVHKALSALPKNTDLEKNTYVATVEIPPGKLLVAYSLSEIYAERANPDLRVNFFQWTEPNTIAEQIQFYQKQFPDSSVVHKALSALTKNADLEKNTYVATVVIPSGKLLVAYWDLFVVIMLTLVLQLVMCFTSPVNARIGRLLVILVGVWFLGDLIWRIMFPSLAVPPTLYESSFFLFAHHLGWFAVITLGVFVFVQWIALKRIQHFEVI